MCFVQSWHNSSKSVTPFSKSGMASPFDLTSFPGFKSFGIERDDVCDDDGAVFALQMSNKRSREEGPYNAMLARLLDGAKLLLADEEDEEYDTSRNQGPGGTKIKQRRRSYSKLARWAVTDDIRIWMLPKYCTGTSASSNIRIMTIQDF